MAHNLTTTGVILRRTNYGEADRILAVLTPDNGEISVMARGVRREKSKLAGGIELFSICELGLVRGSGNTDGLWTLTSSRINVFYDQIMTDYDRLQFGYQVIKQIAGLGNVIDSPDLYTILTQVLAALNNIQIDLRLIQIWYCLHMAKLKGSELNLLTDNNGMRLVEGVSYNYDLAEKVFVYAEHGGRFDTEIIKLLRLLSVNPIAILGKLGSIDGKTVGEALYLANVAAESC